MVILILDETITEKHFFDKLKDAYFLLSPNIYEKLCNDLPYPETMLLIAL